MADQKKHESGGGEGQDLLKMSIDELFKSEPSWRASRRKNLFQQRMTEHAEEEASRKGLGKQALWEAARVGNLEDLMNKLFRQKDFQASSEDLSHGIRAAAAHGREDIIDLLVRHGADPSDSNSPQNFTPLMLAASHGHVHAVLHLIDRGAELNARNELGQTALMLAAANGQAHVVKALLAEDAEPWHKDRYGRTALDCARLETEDHALCRSILEQGRPKPRPPKKVADWEDTDGKTPVHHYLVNSMHGDPRQAARSGLEYPTNLA
mmetsp:Transcript_29623/g.67052  ORF Transcript_29623/g.67052 Transcript_29623/m.67052 type:complete len:266 (-) Transcript_29623:26-823(-)